MLKMKKKKVITLLRQLLFPKKKWFEANSSVGYCVFRVTNESSDFFTEEIISSF